MPLRRATTLALAGMALAVALTSGCATNRSEIGLGVPSTSNPETGHYAKIAEVRDLRKFEV